MRECHKIAGSSSKVALPNLPEKPHQNVNFSFPKRQYGRNNPVKCSFKTSWFASWPFLHYNEADDTVFCYTCIKALTLKSIMTSHNFSPAFVSYVLFD